MAVKHLANWTAMGVGFLSVFNYAPQVAGAMSAIWLFITITTWLYSGRAREWAKLQKAWFKSWFA